jgi:uncharacterized membrane protein YidH (DUF202 family)
MASRFARYVRRLVRTAIALAIFGLVLTAVQATFHPFDEILRRGTALVDRLDSKLSREAFSGITMGSLALILALCIFPLFLSRIDERAYGRGLWRGVIAAAVFYLSNELFALASRIGRIHFIISMLVVIVVTAIVVEGVSLAVREEEEKSFRTDIVSSITSGLLFGVLVKLGEFGLEYARKCLAK